MKNIDKKIVVDFGEEWNKYLHSEISNNNWNSSWDQYFYIFLFSLLPEDNGFCNIEFSNKMPMWVCIEYKD